MSAWDALLAAVEDLNLPDGCKLLVAVSGGADSVALLHAMAQIAPARGWQLRAGHVNHGWRGPESDEDARFVAALAGSLGVPLDVIRVGARAKSEAEAREARYSALRTMLRDWSGNLIATGHQAGDQAETLLLHLARGSGLRGASGMRRETGDLVRPFLLVPRSTIVAALMDKDIHWREDSSNVDRRYARNRLRHDVLPGLEGIHRGAEAHLARTAIVLGVEEEYMSAETARAAALMDLNLADGGVEGAVGSFRALHPALQARAAGYILEAVVGEADAGHVEALRTALLGPPSEVRNRFPGALSLAVGPTRFRLGPERALPGWEAVPLRAPGSVMVPAGEVGARWDVEDRHALAVCAPWHAVLDGGRIGNLLVRPRLPGDRMRPLGSPGTRKVQDIMVDARIPRAVRGGFPLVVDDEGPVWIPGVATADRAALLPATVRILHLTFRPGAALDRDRMQRIS